MNPVNEKGKKLRLFGARLLVLVTAFALHAGYATAKDKMPEKTADGLVLKHDTDLSAVYVAPGATLKAYERIYLVDAYVAFAKDWQRDYNRDHFGARVSDHDMKEIKEGIAEEFKKEFTKVLTEGGYKVTEDMASDVMILRPAIINVQISAPDVSADMRRVVVSEAGTMTLYLELYDAATSSKFAEIYDAEAVGDRSFGYVANRVTNRAELDRTLRAWAERLVKRLDEAHQVMGAKYVWPS